MNMNFAFLYRLLRNSTTVTILQYVDYCYHVFIKYRLLNQLIYNNGHYDLSGHVDRQDGAQIRAFQLFDFYDDLILLSVALCDDYTPCVHH